MKMHEEYMREAIALSLESVAEGGGPFGAVIVNKENGEVIGRGKNRVAIEDDPVAHAEIEAIGDASKKVDGTDLTNCVLYASSEPCPGCLTEALFNADIKEIYYGNSVADAGQIGFADDKNWEVLETTAAEMTEKAGGKITQILRDEAQVAFKAWREKIDKVEYYQA